MEEIKFAINTAGELVISTLLAILIFFTIPIWFPFWLIIKIKNK